jgi:hypothetical protein
MPWWNSANSCNLSRGRATAAALAGAWRGEPPRLELDLEQLRELAGFLLGSGAGGLTWWRLRRSSLRDTNAAAEFRQAYRLHSLQTGLHQQHLQRVVTLLRGADTEPLLCKGWAVARLYPEPGLRPYGDLDLCVAPDHLSRAAGALAAAGDLGSWVDLHAGVAELADRPWHDLLARSRLASAGGLPVRVLGPEDQLRQLALHLLRHGAWRPLWLCDIAVTTEAAPADFDWDLCLAGDSPRAQWVAAALLLAQHLLGARLPEPVASQLGTLPRWLAPVVLHQWGSGRAGDSHTCDTRPMASYLRRPAGLLRALACRWPNPIEAAVRLGTGPRGRLPRLVLQLSNAASRFAAFATLRKVARRRGQSAEGSFEVHQS